MKNLIFNIKGFSNISEYEMQVSFVNKKPRYGESVDVLNNEVIQRSKIRIDTRKWLASKLKPKKYSEKLQTELSGPGGKDLKVVISKDDLDL